MIRTRLIFTLIIGHLVIGIIPLLSARAEISIRSERSRMIMQSIWSGNFDPAINDSQRIIAEESENPIGYFLAGLTYYSINSQYRNDNFADSATFYLNNAISLAQKMVVQKESQAEYYFIIGSSFGCLALFKSNHGGWWGAIRDGIRSSSNLGKAYAMDSTLTDALGGIGAYNYWKSTKTRIISWLPFAGDKREQSIAQIVKSIESGNMMTVSSKKSLLAIYYDHMEYDKVLAIGDSLEAANYLDPNSRLHIARALIKLNRLDDADLMLNKIQSIWEASKYFDLCGATEVPFLRAEILLARGDTSGAEQICHEISSMNDPYKANAFFKQTLAGAKALSSSF